MKKKNEVTVQFSAGDQKQLKKMQDLGQNIH